MNFDKIFEPEKYFNEIPNVHCIMACTKFMSFAISNDSGVSHILSTGDCNLFKLFNNKIPSKFTKNYTNIHYVEPKLKNDISSIEVDEVYNFITKKLE